MIELIIKGFVPLTEIPTNPCWALGCFSPRITRRRHLLPCFPLKSVFIIKVLPTFSVGLLNDMQSNFLKVIQGPCSFLVSHQSCLSIIFKDQERENHDQERFKLLCSLLWFLQFCLSTCSPSRHQGSSYHTCVAIMLYFKPTNF